MSNVKINILYARTAPIAVIFRRGPAKWVQVLKWNTMTDQIIEGQWFNGIVFPHKTDLSPCGTYMIYFAATFSDTQKHMAWTAISKPPYLTALALWKQKSLAEGGGLFINKDKIYLNHRCLERKPEIHSELGRLQIKINKTNWAQVFDIYGAKRLRDHWIWSNNKSSNIRQADIQVSKFVNHHCSLIELGFKKSHRNYDWQWYVKYDQKLFPLNGFENVDIHNHRILMSKNGCLYSFDQIDDVQSMKNLKFIKDLNGNKPNEIVSSKHYFQQ